MVWKWANLIMMRKTGGCFFYFILFYFLIFNNNVVFVLLPHWPSQCFLQNYLRVTCDICVVKDNFELS